MRSKLELAGLGALRAAALASMCLAGAALAREPQGAAKMTLSGYVDAAAGPALLAGHYDDVIAALGGRGFRFKEDAVAGSTNLCVAYIMAHRWQAADPACGEAIRFARLETTESQPYALAAHADHVAIAYSNRAVLEWLEGRQASAADDLAKARSIAPASDSVVQNLAKLGGHAPLLGRETARPGAHAPARGPSGASSVAAATHG